MIPGKNIPKVTQKLIWSIYVKNHGNTLIISISHRVLIVNKFKTKNVTNAPPYSSDLTPYKIASSWTLLSFDFEQKISFGYYITYNFT